MKTRPEFLVDADEVLADFQTPALDLIATLTGERYAPEDFTEWDIFGKFPSDVQETVFKTIDELQMVKDFEPLPGAIEAIQEIQEYADVFAVTSSHHSRNWYYDRVEWLHRHFGLSTNHVIQAGTKYLVDGDFFLDDKPDHVLKWRARRPGKHGMLWHIPCTRLLGHDDIRVRSWDEVIEKVKKFAKEEF